MNKQRRAELDKLITQMTEIHGKLEELKDDEQLSWEQMPEGLQQSENGQKTEENADRLSSACDDLQSAIDSIQESVDA